MIALGHTAVGIIVGASAYHFLGKGDLISGLIITGTAGVVSHYITDFIPHGHFIKPSVLREHLKTIIIFDLFLPILFFLILAYFKGGLFNGKLLYLAFGIGGAQLPDIVNGLFKAGLFKPNSLLVTEHHFHKRLHWHGRDSQTLLLGLLDVWQVIVVLVALYLTLY